MEDRIRQDIPGESGVFPEKERRWCVTENKLTYPVKSPIVLGVLSLENLSNWLLKEKNQRPDSLPFKR